MDRQALIRRLEEIVGPQGVISERNQLRTYECDGLANFRVIPSVVVLPETADQVQGTSMTLDAVRQQVREHREDLAGRRAVGKVGHL